MNVNLPIEDLIDARVKAMKPTDATYQRWFFSVVRIAAVVGVIVLIAGMRTRLSRLETIVATDREFAHGMSADLLKATKELQDFVTPPQDVIDGPASTGLRIMEDGSGGLKAIPIQPRALPESQLPAVKEGQP